MYTVHEFIRYTTCTCTVYLLLLTVLSTGLGTLATEVWLLDGGASLLT